MASEDTDWIFDCVVNIFHSPEWETPIYDFIDENCIIFDGEEENKLQYSEVHNNFVSLVENLLEGQLSNLGITSDQFIVACDKARSRSGLEKSVIQSLLAMEDFMSFKNMMKKRNMELELEALQQLKRHTVPETKSSRAVPSGLAEGLESYERLVRGVIEETDAMLALNEQVTMKEAAIERGKEAHLASLPAAEKAREVAELKREAEKLDHEALASQKRMEELQAEVERSKKVADERETSDLKVRVAEAEAARERAKADSEKLSSLAESAQRVKAPVGGSSGATVDKRQLDKADLEMRNLRARMDKLQAVEALPVTDSSVTDEHMKEVIQERKLYLREQRAKILASKQAERREELEKYKKETDEFVKAELKKPVADPAVKEDDRRREAMRKKLTHRLKMDMLADQESKSSAGLPQPHELESMEDQLMRAQELREEKKRREKMMTDKMTKEASLRAKKAKDGMKGTEDW